MYVIRFKLAAPDRTLAPSEQRALLALRALDKNSNGIKRNKQDTKHDCYRNCSRLQYIPRGDNCPPWCTQMTPVHSQNNSSVRSLGSGSRGVARAIQLRQSACAPPCCSCCAASAPVSDSAATMARAPVPSLPPLLAYDLSSISNSLKHALLDQWRCGKRSSIG